MLELFFGKPNITYSHFEKFFADEFMKDDDVVFGSKAEKGSFNNLSNSDSNYL